MTPWTSWIGCLRISFLLLIGAGMAVTAPYQGKCFSEQKIYGNARMSIRQPTEIKSSGFPCNALDSDCESNFTALDQLPYCTQYIGENATAGQLIIKISYTSSPFEDPSYTISCRWTPSREYKVEYVTPSSDSPDRLLHDKHGVLI